MCTREKIWSMRERKNCYINVLGWNLTYVERNWPVIEIQSVLLYWLKQRELSSMLASDSWVGVVTGIYATSLHNPLTYFRVVNSNITSSEFWWWSLKRCGDAGGTHIVAWESREVVDVHKVLGISNAVLGVISVCLQFSLNCSIEM